jgi:hypothetical protein
MKHVLAFLAFLLIAIPSLGAASTQSDPIVIVYPLAVTGSGDGQVGGKIAAVYATRLAALGGLSVKDPAAGTDRQHFLAAARDAGADYYVTGYISPLGNSATLINQVVSTHSGIQVWSNSVQIESFTEAGAQADAIRGAILRHAGRYSVALEATPPPAAPAAPSAQKNEANLNALFQKHPPSESAPISGGQSGETTVAQSGAATTDVPSGDDVQVAAVHVIGTADLAGKFSADDQIRLQLTKRIKAPVALDFVTSDFTLQGPQICLSSSLIRSARVFGGTLALQRYDPAGFSQFAVAKFDLIVYDCQGNVVAKAHSETRENGRTADELAVNNAVNEAFDAIFKPAKKHR